MSERATRRSIVVECRILSEGSRQQATPPRPVDHHTDALLLAARENLLFHPPVEHAVTVLDHFNPCRRRGSTRRPTGGLTLQRLLRVESAQLPPV